MVRTVEMKESQSIYLCSAGTLFASFTFVFDCIPREKWPKRGKRGKLRGKAIFPALSAPQPSKISAGQ